MKQLHPPWGFLLQDLVQFHVLQRHILLQKSITKLLSRTRKFICIYISSLIAAKQITVSFLQVQNFPCYFSTDIRGIEENKASLLIFKLHGSSTSTASKQWHSLKKDQEFRKITIDKLLEHVWRAAQYGTKERCLNTVGKKTQNQQKNPNPTPQTKPDPGQAISTISDKLMHSIWQPGLALFNWRDKKTQVLKYSHWKDNELRNM